jgi:hypothetical protein
MVSEQHVLDMIVECNKDRVKTFAEFIALTFKDKFIEIYLGDSYEEVSTEQISTSYPAVFCGKVISAYRECLILNSVFINKSRKMQLGNIVCISERAIRGLNEIDGHGIIEDLFLRSRESLDIKTNFIDNIQKLNEK